MPKDIASMLSPPTFLAIGLALLAQNTIWGINEAPTRTIFYLWSALQIAIFILLRNIPTYIFINTIFHSVFLTTTAIRRLYFHPLSSWPGHKRAALTKLYEAYLYFTGINALEIRRLHRSHGDFLRTGPNEVAINNVEALQLYSRQNFEVIRGPFYKVSAIVGDVNLISTRESSRHKTLRGIWEQAFKTNAVKEYSPRVELHVDRFIENLKATEGKPFDCVPVICNMTFDIMADLGFGKDYGMQLGIGDPSYMGYMHKYMRIIAMTGALPTLSDLVPLLPQHADTKAFQKKGRVMMEERISLGKNRQDIFNHLLSADSESGRKLSHSELDSNAQLIIIAGADTTSSVLSNLFRELALNPEIQERLYQEIMDAKIRNGGTKFDCENTKSLPYLQAVIDESLRLWPPVPAGAQAQTGPSGATVAGRYIPPFTGVRVHHLSMLTDERYFPQGSRFWPERWLGENRQEGVKDIRAFVPFSYGPHVCIGKHLAYNEMRLAVARTVEGFKVTLGEGFCEERYRDEWRDYFTVMIGGIEMVFRPRD